MGSDVAGRRPVLDVYARLSRAYNGETIQVDDQVEVCLEELAERDADAGEVFKDNSLSAWKPNVVRKDWEALMARLESGASDGVIVYDLTRFSRKIREGERLVELAAKGIRVWSLSGEYDLTTADGRRHFREANGFGMDPFPHRGLEPPAVEPGIRQQQQASLVRNIAGFHMVDIDRRVGRAGQCTPHHCPSGSCRSVRSVPSSPWHCSTVGWLVSHHDPESPSSL